MTLIKGLIELGSRFSTQKCKIENLGKKIIINLWLRVCREKVWHWNRIRRRVIKASADRWRRG